MENGIANSKYNDEELYDSYLSLDASKDAIINQAEVIRKIAKEGGQVANNTRKDIESRLGELIVTKDNTLNYKYVEETKQIENK